ncbi:ATP-grasp fold amidoligase family protein [Eubacterium xylanophilum]|uniref:ATP-grasp fold amidoligase family protein n=1 Tax=Eubacterium xylanophilum TaxID=39497 RepID=UPI00047D933B|nr:ATP-grasp fold amidoligase family protein [Eubacterium xylanophilum]
MSLSKKILKILNNPLIIVFTLGRNGWFNWMDDSSYLNMLYWCVFHKKLDLDNPKSYNEKLQWLKLHDRKDYYSDLVDKYEVKRIVSNIIGDEYIIPTLGVWERFEDIDFSKLPQKFVLKCTHDSGGIVICKDKDLLNLKAAKKKINKSLKSNFYWQSREWAYKNIRPRIIAEVYMSDDSGKELNDYKMMCFNGKFDNTMICVGRYSEQGVRYYHMDRDWKFLPYVYYENIDEADLEDLKPKNYEEMITIAEKLCVGFPHIRVDLYNISGKIYFGELTFFQSGGFDNDFTEDAKMILGDKIVLGKS